MKRNQLSDVKRPVLVNAAEMARQHPKTFRVPDTSGVQKGSYVKVSNNEERFWVKVTLRFSDVLVGIVDNDLIFNCDLRLGDRIMFHVDNVYSVWEGAL